MKQCRLCDEYRGPDKHTEVSGGFKESEMYADPPCIRSLVSEHSRDQIVELAVVMINRDRRTGCSVATLIIWYG
jgi:hypothetical protein